MKKWWDIGTASDLFYVDNGTHLLIWDLRPVAHQPLTVLTGLQKVLYEKCQAPQTLSELKKDSGSESDIQSVLEPIVNRGLMLHDQKSYLSLAIPLGVYQPKGDALQKFCEILEKLGKTEDMQFTIPQTAFCPSQEPASVDV